MLQGVAAVVSILALFAAMRTLTIARREREEATLPRWVVETKIP